MAILPSNLRADPYGWLTNQISHIGLGVSLVVTFCVLGALMFDEFPDKMAIFAAIAAIYFLIEYPQHGPLADSIEDAVFVVLYGAAIPLVLFDWVGGWRFAGDLSRLFPWIWVLILHLAAGYGVREWQRSVQK